MRCHSRMRSARSMCRSSYPASRACCRVKKPSSWQMARSGSSIATWSADAGVHAYAVPVACGQGPDRPCWGRFAVTFPGDASPWDVDEPTLPHVDQPWEVRAERHPMVKQQRTAGSGDDVEAGHHPVVLVVEHVAVDHEGAGVVGEAG